MEIDDILYGLIQELRRGTIVLCALKRLDSPKYGYSLVGELSNSGMPVEANTLYPLLRRLESQGLLESRWETGETKPRKYYVTTDMGKQVCASLEENWKKTVESMNKILEG